MSCSCRPHISPILNPPTSTDSQTANRVYSGKASATAFTSCLLNGRTSSFFGLLFGVEYLQGLSFFNPSHTAALINRLSMNEALSYPSGEGISFFAFRLHSSTSSSVMSFNGMPWKYGMRRPTASFVRRMVRPRIRPFFSKRLWKYVLTHSSNTISDSAFFLFLSDGGVHCCMPFSCIVTRQCSSSSQAYACARNSGLNCFPTFFFLFIGFM